MVTTATHPSAKVEYHLTEDVKPEWLNVVRRLQSACHGNQGYAVLSIAILVDDKGKPVGYLEPLLHKIEPKSLVSKTLLELCYSA